MEISPGWTTLTHYTLLLSCFLLVVGCSEDTCSFVAKMALSRMGVYTHTFSLTPAAAVTWHWFEKAGRWKVTKPVIMLLEAPEATYADRVQQAAIIWWLLRDIISCTLDGKTSNGRKKGKYYCIYLSTHLSICFENMYRGTSIPDKRIRIISVFSILRH